MTELDLDIDAILTAVFRKHMGKCPLADFDGDAPTRARVRFLDSAGESVENIAWLLDLPKQHVVRARHAIHRAAVQRRRSKGDA